MSVHGEPLSGHVFLPGQWRGVAEEALRAGPRRAGPAGPASAAASSRPTAGSARNTSGDESAAQWIQKLCLEVLLKVTEGY